MALQKKSFSSVKIENKGLPVYPGRVYYYSSMDIAKVKDKPRDSHLFCTRHLKISMDLNVNTGYLIHYFVSNSVLGLLVRMSNDIS